VTILLFSSQFDFDLTFYKEFDVNLISIRIFLVRKFHRRVRRAPVGKCIPY